MQLNSWPIMWGDVRAQIANVPAGTEITMKPDYDAGVFRIQSHITPDHYSYVPKSLRSRLLGGFSI
jgi:hypothetical protein